MKYDFAIAYNLSEDDFEALTNSICQNILGTGVVSFTKGKDGGKDGRFSGIANNYPSQTSPWSGNMIIQSKHTNNPIATCLCGDFFKNKTSIINKEIKKIIEIKNSEGLDYYLLFTNRKYTGGADCEIRKKISRGAKLSINNIGIIGIETINSYLNSHKQIVKQYNLNKYIIPIDFSDEEIKDLIIEFKDQLPQIEEEIKNKVEKVKYDYDKISDKKKNIKNKLSIEYYEQSILGESLKYFDKIDIFLSDPKNEYLKDFYFDIVAELKNKIQIKRDEFGVFEEIFIFIYEEICRNESKLKGKKRFVYTFLHYMYHTCSIGLK